MSTIRNENSGVELTNWRMRRDFEISPQQRVAELASLKYLNLDLLHK